MPYRIFPDPVVHVTVWEIEGDTFVAGFCGPDSDALNAAAESWIGEQEDPSLYVIRQGNKASIEEARPFFERRPVQICVTNDQGFDKVFVLCNDGSIWKTWGNDPWRCVKPIPQDDENGKEDAK